MVNVHRIISISSCHHDSGLCNVVISENQNKVATLVIPVNVVGDIIECNL